MKSIVCILFAVIFFNQNNIRGERYAATNNKDKFEDVLDLSEISDEKYISRKNVESLSPEVVIYQILKGEIDYDDITNALNKQIEPEDEITTLKSSNIIKASVKNIEITSTNLSSEPPQINNSEATTKLPKGAEENSNIEEHTLSQLSNFPSSSNNGHHEVSPQVSYSNMKRLQDPDLRDYPLILSWYVNHVFECALNNINNTHG